MGSAVERAIERATGETDGVYLSFDMDALDPLHAPGVGTPVPAGLSQREAHLACELIGGTGKLVGMDMVEVNPILDVQNRTAILAVDFVLSALGKRIWEDD
jgi:arginase